MTLCDQSKRNILKSTCPSDNHHREFGCPRPKSACPKRFIKTVFKNRINSTCGFWCILIYSNVNCFIFSTVEAVYFSSRFVCCNAKSWKFWLPLILKVAFSLLFIILLCKDLGFLLATTRRLSWFFAWFFGWLAWKESKQHGLMLLRFHHYWLKFRAWGLVLTGLVTKARWGHQTPPKQMNGCRIVKFIGIFTLILSSSRFAVITVRYTCISILLQLEVNFPLFLQLFRHQKCACPTDKSCLRFSCPN